jgi:hypothetical protein
MALISMREFARRNGLSDMAISKAVKAGRMPSTSGKIDPDQAQQVWDRIKDPVRAGRKLPRGGSVRGSSSQGTDPDARKLDCEPRLQATETPPSDEDCSDAHAGVESPTEPNPSGSSDCKLEACTSDAQVHRQVCSAGGRSLYPPPPTNGRDQIAITIPLNGAEEMELAKRSAAKGVSLPVYVLTTVGYDHWRLDAARSRPARSLRRRPVRHGLERRSVTMVVSGAVFEDLWWRSAPSGLTIPQFIRTLLAFEVRRYSNPGTCERDHEFEDAWDRLLRLELDPKVYLPDE